MPWDQERTEQCVKLWNEGLSANHIASRLGGVSRNAVIGKIHRMGLSHTSPGRPFRTYGKRIKASKPRKPKRVPAFGKPLPPEQPTPDKLFGLADLESNQCRFPYGDPQEPGFGFCGCETQMGSSYCPWHHHLCLVPPNTTRRNRTVEWRYDRKQPQGHIRKGRCERVLV